MQDEFNEADFYGKQAPATPVNPLAAYFRAPGVTVKLPTGGEAAVYPMTAADEILLKSPDALMSGAAIEGMISSCIPSVERPREVVLPDLEVMLLGIRAATYGDRLEIEASCPKCGHEHEVGVSLASILQTAQPVEAACELDTADGLVFKLRPYTMGLANVAANAVFAETRKVQAAQIEGDEAAMAVANDAAIKAIAGVTQDGLARSIISITTPDGKIVSEYPLIRELLQHYPAAQTKKIEDKISEMNSKGMDKTVKLTCNNCAEPFKVDIDLDPSSFFVNAS